MFISEGNPNLKTWFFGVVLGLTTISKMILDPPLKSVGPPTFYKVSAIGPPTIHIHARTPMGMRGCVKEPHIG